MQEGILMKIHFSFQRLCQSLMWRFFAFSKMRFRLRSGLEVPVADRHEMATFREIFIQQEYDDFLERLPLPGGVLDLGCNSGYFATHVLNRALVNRGRGNLPAKLVLVDANERAVARAREVLGGCGASVAAEYVHGLVDSRGKKAASFYVAEASAESSAARRVKNAREIQVPCVDLEGLMRAHFPEGVDLIKCDIEGGEEVLAREWADVLRQAKALIVEWHGFHGGWKDFQQALAAAGFELEAEHPAGRFKNALFLRRQA